MRIKFRDIDFVMAHEFPPYNQEFFERVNSHQWEPDTIGFLENHLDSFGCYRIRSRHCHQLRCVGDRWRQIQMGD